MNRNYHIIFGALAGLAMPGTAAALDFAVGAHGGTMGTGIEATFGLNSHLNLRAGINSGEYEIMEVEDDGGLEYDDPKVDFDNQYLMLDIYPFSGGNMHLTAGYFINKNSITAGAVVTDSNQNVGNNPAPVGTRVNSLIKFEDGGYVGIGFGNAASGGLIHFGLDIGVVMQGSPQVGIQVLDPTGVERTDPDVEAERQDLENEVKDADMWPVVNLSLSFQFF